MPIFRKYSSIFFDLLCLMEGVGVLLVFILGTEGAISSLRWLLIGLVAFLILFFGVHALRGWIAREKATSLANWILAREQLVVLLFISFSLASIVFGILVYSPIRLEKLYAYALRWQPILVWAFLICTQFFMIGIILQSPAKWLAVSRQLRDEPHLKQIQSWLNSPAMGISMIAAGFLLGLTKLGFNQFADEANNFVYGWLITLGRLPYRDVFSQHFPFAYYWSAGVIAIFGNSQAALRISLLVLQAVLFAYTALATRQFFPVGLTALVWGLTSQFHRGNMVLYDSFDGIFILSAFILIFPQLVDRSRMARKHMLLAGCLLGCACLSNPLMLYPVLVVLFFVFLWGMLISNRDGFWERIRPVMWIGVSIGVVLGGFGLFSLISGSLYDLYRDVIWFNAVIYDKYTEASPNRLSQIFYQITTGLDLLNPVWRRHTSLTLDLAMVRSHLTDEGLYYSWIFSSFLFRLSIVLTSLGLLVRRKFLAGLFLYTLASTLLVRSTTSWHAIPFIWLSLFAGAYYLANMFSLPEAGLSAPPAQNPRRHFVTRAGGVA